MLLLTILATGKAVAAVSVIVDNSDPGYSDSSSDGGAWKTGTGAAAKYGADYRFGDCTGSISSTTGTAVWQPDLPYAGDYNVYAWWTQGGNRSNNAPYTMNGPLDSTTVRVNQQANGGQWNFIGRHYFAAGTTGTVTLTNNANPLVVIADAIKFEYASEIRAFWATRFEWPSATTSTAQANIVDIMNRAQTNNFNTVLFQVRGQMDVHYNSPYEPWASNYNWTNPGWDPLNYAIGEAHSRGLELHAYVNTHTISNSPFPPAVTTPQHMHNVHGVGQPPGVNWTIHNTAGNPLAAPTDGYYWLSPGIPEASHHTRRSLVHLAKSYEIDGMHFDRIRCPGPGYSYDPISVARFNGDGNPDALDWGDFMRSQITRDVRNIYAEIMYWKPAIKISSSPIGINKRNSTSGYQGWGNAAYPNYYQDSYAWMEAHVHDFIIPQIYWELGSNHPYEVLLADWLQHSSGRFIVGGSRTGLTVNTGPKPIGDNEVGLIDEQQETRNQNAAGHCVFSYTSLDTVPPGETVDFWTGFSTYNYDLPSTTPEMIWKTRPTTGYIVGYVKDALGNPVVDGRVNLTGDSYNYLSAYDGFFAMVDVAAATTHSLNAFKLGTGSAQQNAIAVTAGQVTSLTLTLAGSRGVIDFEKPYYNFNALAKVRAYDADQAGSGNMLVSVTSTAEPAGESVTLTETTPGRFEGTIQLQETASTSGDSLLRTAPGGSVTVSRTDPDDGTGNSLLCTDTAPVIFPKEIIIESRQATSGGPRTPAPNYQEFNGTWADTGNVGAPSKIIKSIAPGLSGMGGRYTGTGSQGAYALFTPTIIAPGKYDVFITLPSATMGSDNHSPGAGYTIIHDGGTINGTFDLSRFNSAITDQWYLLAADVPFAAGTSGSIRITNNNANSNTVGERFNIDAMKLVVTSWAPVQLSGFSVE